MARVFLSYSHHDSGFVERLATDLERLGHDIWLDKWKISVGHQIPDELERGLLESDFVIVILSKAACASNWVEQEWKAKYWEEVKKNQVLVLPVLREDCEIPPLLQPKLYADCRADYTKGLVQLADKLGNPGRARLQEILALITFLLNHLISDWELEHLRKVYSGECGKVGSAFYHEELGRLCAMKFLKLRSGKHIREIGPHDDLCDFVEPTGEGKQYLELRDELNARSGGLFTI